MADELVTHSDGEQRQKSCLCVNDFPSSRIPLEDRTGPTSDTSICISNLSVLKEAHSSLVELFTRPRSSHGSTTPLESQQEFQQEFQKEESNVLLAYKRSFDSLFDEGFISNQSCVDEAAHQRVQLCPRELASRLEARRRILSLTLVVFHHLFLAYLSQKRLQCKQCSQRYPCRAHPWKYNTHEHTGTRLYAKSYQNSQHRFSHKTWLLCKKKKREKEKQTFLSSLKDSIRSDLECVRSTLDLVSITMDLLDDATMSLDTIQDEILEWLKKIEQISDRLLEKLRHVYTQLFVYAIIFFWRFKEFPNGIRHLCTTMPWTIWPALVVLWGVCWMFHSGPVFCAVDEAEQLLPLEQEQLPRSQDDRLGEDDYGIDLPDTALLDDFAAFPWDFWSDSAGVTYNWGLINQLGQIDGAAASSITPALPPTATSLLTTILNRNQRLDTKQFTSEDLSHAGSLSFLESPPQSPTDVNLMRQNTGNSIQANRTHTRTQRGSYKCPNCDKSFTRSDSLRRHISAKHAKDREYLCSNSGCERSKKGQGFYRRDKWKAHGNGTCKSRTRSTSSNSNSASVLSEAAPQLDNIARASLAPENSGAIQIGDKKITGEGTLHNQDVILELRRLCQTKKEALLIKEKECEAERKDIAHLSAVINLLEDSSPTGGI